MLTPSCSSSACPWEWLPDLGIARHAVLGVEDRKHVKVFLEPIRVAVQDAFLRAKTQGRPKARGGNVSAELTQTPKPAKRRRSLSGGR